MNIGRLRDRVTVANRTEVDDGEGGRTVDYTPVIGVAVPADIRGLRGQERLRAAGDEVVVTHVVTMRALPGVGPATRFTWGTRVLDVVGPPVTLEHRRWLECYCAERFV